LLLLLLLLLLEPPVLALGRGLVVLPLVAWTVLRPLLTLFLSGRRHW
jgi:hypothetical protein